MKDDHYYRLLEELDEFEERLHSARMNQLKSAIGVAVIAVSWLLLLVLVATTR